MRKKVGERLHVEHQPTTKDPSPGRSTFGVARALDTIADVIPNVIYQGRSAPLKLSPEPSRTVAATIQERPAARSARPEARHLTLTSQALPSPQVRDVKEDKCHKRPDDNRPRKSGGSGAGPRRYIPWGC